MSNGLLPPVPDLIPIAALRKSSPCNNNSGARRECAPCATHSEVMGEQRSRRTGSQPSIDLIDSAQSRVPSAAPQAPQSRKARSERHRKSDRRREHRKPVRTRSGSKQSCKSREPSTPTSSPERPPNPRVNPIFVWVRQEDTRIVDVKCEDYDKRNRILLTKTAQGWRAIPRTETLVPSLKEAANDKDQQQHHHHHHHHHRSRKSRKSKVRRKSAAVQVDSDIQDICNDEEEQPSNSPTWTSPVNVESHLPSHKIHVPKRCPSPEQSTDSVNSVVIESAQTQPEKCSAGKICDVSPLDNLLAVAEFEFNQHMQSGEWNKTSDSDILDNDNESLNKTYEDIDEDQKEFINNMEQLNNLLASCSKNNDAHKIPEITDDFRDVDHKVEDCDYTEVEDDDNNLAMDDILSRLEQSLRSPECPEIGQVLNDSQTNFDEDKIDDAKESECFSSDINENDYKPSVPEFENYFIQDESKHQDVIEEEEEKQEIEQTEQQEEEQLIDESIEEHADEESGEGEPPEEEIIAQTIEPESENYKTTKEVIEENTENIVESSTINDDEPTDLSIKSKYNMQCETTKNSCDDVIELPTDLSVPRNQISSPQRSMTSRPPSQNSEAIQSPQPSGIPAVPPSPDIVSPPANSTTKTKSLFLESLLSTTSQTQKNNLSSEDNSVRQKEPLDLGKCRKSASPTVTCSEEVKNNSEPPAKKFKPEDITLKNLLDIEAAKCAGRSNLEKNNTPETPRLLELLKTDSGPDPLTQLKQILYDSNFNVPDPMLVPKERLSQIISQPAREIPRLLKQRPELRLPEALAFPHLLQDPDILVITLQQLETIIIKQNQSFALKDVRNSSSHTVSDKSTKKSTETTKESSHSSKKKSLDENVTTKMTNSSTREGLMGKSAGMNDLTNDIDAATAAAFNQVMWLPYLNQMEAMSFGNNTDIMKILSNSMPIYPGQIPDLNHLVGANRFPSSPVGFPMQQPPMNYNHSLELSMWQEAMIQANMLRPKIPFNALNPKNSFRDYLDKFNSSSTPAKKSSINNHKIPPINKPSLPNNFYNLNNNLQHSTHYQNSFLNIPSAYQPTPNTSSSKQNLQIPHYNPLISQKNLVNQQSPSIPISHPYLPKPPSQKIDPKSNFTNFYHHHSRAEEKMQHTQRQEANSHHKPKLSCKPFANVSHQKHASLEQKEKSLGDFSKHHTTQPIDLSGSTTPGSKLKVKQHLIDPVKTPKLLKHDDIPEVGSTTASIEEMQDAHKHLWHPLFGNQKGYNSPWNWTTVTATAE